MKTWIALAVLTLAPSSVALAEALPGAESPPEVLAPRLEAARGEAGAEPRTRHRDPQGRPLFVNRLALEPSPYLRQHAFNPVNWFPWGDEAFAEARRLNRPILLSIGYSTCHWCHVMEEESFEDLEIAEYLNKNYVTIKVDREERPDIDALYMTAVQAMTGRGGWPMNSWLTPDAKPFYGGTYFPPRDGVRGTRTGLLTLLKRLRELYERDPERVIAHAQELAAAVRDAVAPQPAVGVPDGADIELAVGAFRSRFDHSNGGVRQRHKFPATLPIPLLLRTHRRTGEEELAQMARQTLDAMRRGGLYDQVGGGFHRYTVDATWTVPHFEKMLYDNALLVLAFLEGWQSTGDPAYAWVARDVLDYVAREMTTPIGTFYSATDADSEGEEGLYFIWDPASVRAAVGEELAPLALAAYGVEGSPNFEGKHWVLRRDRSLEELAEDQKKSVEEIEQALHQIRSRMREARAQRIPPERDDKQVVGWNGLMIQAFARAGLALRDPALAQRGAEAAAALLERAHRDGILARYLKDGVAHGSGVVDDYAFLIAGLLDLFEATGKPRWLASAISLQAEQDRRFFDDEAGGYWMTARDEEALLAPQKRARDDARPSGNAVAAMNLLRLYHLTTDAKYRVQAEMTLRAFSDLLERSPTSHGRMLEAVDFMLDTPLEILIVTPPGELASAEPFLVELGRTYLPNRVIAVVSEDRVPELLATIPLLDQKKALRDQTTAYVCQDRVCARPAQDPALFAQQIRPKPRPYRNLGDGP